MENILEKRTWGAFFFFFFGGGGGAYGPKGTKTHLQIMALSIIFLQKLHSEDGSE